MTGGQMIAVNAYGKIALYELIQGTLLVSAVPLMWFFFKLGFGPVSVGYALFVTMIIYCVGRIVFAKRLTGFQFLPWVKMVALPLAGVILLSVLVGEALQLCFEAGFVRLFSISAAVGFTVLLASWMILFATEEKAYILSFSRRWLRI